MKSKILGLLAAGLLAGSIPANAGIVISTDSETELTGTFSIVLNGYTTATSTKFKLLPEGDNCLKADRTIDSVLFFGACTVGTPDTPFFVTVPYPSSDTSFPDFSGVYNNTPSSTDVYFRFSSLRDTGGESGVFSGSFCFKLSADACDSAVPEPGTLALLGLGLAGLGLSRRRIAA